MVIRAREAFAESVWIDVVRSAKIFKRLGMIAKLCIDQADEQVWIYFVELTPVHRAKSFRMRPSPVGGRSQADRD